jgi:beta-N-acetylhexosaminidase
MGVPRMTATVAAVVVVLAVLAVVLPAIATPAQDQPAAGGSTRSRGTEPCAQVARLTDAQLVAQVLGAAFTSPAVTADAARSITSTLGAVVLLGPSIEDGDQVRRLVGDLQAAAPAMLPTLIAVDEEGGRVARFGRSGLVAHLPSARQQAAAGTPDDVRQQAAGLGAELAALGVDLNLAPVLDLSDDPDRTIIGDRSFSSDPALAGTYATAFAAGMGDAQVLTSGKHFPDHGLTTVDSHTDVAVVDVTLDELRRVHLAPYRIALPHLDSIMLSHLRVPALDPSHPVSLSAPAVAFLRAELGYDGVVVTDDLSMQAVAAVADQPTAALRSIQAGADLALLGSVSAAADAHVRLLSALGDGELPRHRLRDAAIRVLRMRDIDPRAVSCMVGPTHFVRPR